MCFGRSEGVQVNNWGSGQGLLVSECMLLRIRINFHYSLNAGFLYLLKYPLDGAAAGGCLNNQ